ncbi:SDR family NAD(P)-dependent oxidoreductase [Neorhizobium sp. P12A]|uniref:SDR family oxidoreductase n=1 Tax=Neorhizobium sp. P12A TaxID=2268027 RepID=UPI0011EFFCFE|nr:SDR family oxidoreductase [Neorhizobium sp. P12A]KAA0689185.1 SDR family NAD(P)-dependent oxidoreductase [Neorhizobium sp. P12A]
MGQKLKGKVALVTGASSGIGRATALALREEGAKLALIGRSAERLEAVADKAGGDVIVLPADLTKPDALQNAVDAATQHFGRIDILLPNAGLYIPGDVAEGEPDAWDELISINVNSVFRLVRAVLPGMIAHGGGQIVVTSSVAGHQAIHWEPIYSASKHAIQAFVHGLRRQTMRHNIRVGSVAPGVVLNELWGYTDPIAIDTKVASREGLRSEDVADAVIFMLTRPANVTIRDLVILPQIQDI